MPATSPGASDLARCPRTRSSLLVMEDDPSPGPRYAEIATAIGVCPSPKSMVRPIVEASCNAAATVRATFAREVGESTSVFPEATSI